MPALSNHRHERFAQALAKGKTATEAMEAAGLKDNRNVTRLSKNPGIAARVAEILDAGAMRAEISVEMVLRELGRIGFSNVMDYMRIGPDGEPLVDFSEMTREQAAALSEVTVEEFKESGAKDARSIRRVKFKLHDKRAALVDIGRHLGMFVERAELGKPGEFAKMDMEQKRARAIAMAEQLGLARLGPVAGSA